MKLAEEDVETRLRSAFTTHLEDAVGAASTPRSSYSHQARIGGRYAAIALVAVSALGALAFAVTARTPHHTSGSTAAAPTHQPATVTPATASVTTSAQIIPDTTVVPTAATLSQSDVSWSDAAVQPTVLAPSETPAGLPLLRSGSMAFETTPSLTASSADGHQSYTISLEAGQCAGTQVRPGTSPDRDAAAVALIGKSQIPLPQGFPVDLQAIWCDGNVRIQVDGTGIEATTLTQVVSTITATSGRNLSFGLLGGFHTQQNAPSFSSSELIYGTDAAANLHVISSSNTDGHLNATEFGTTSEVTIAGHDALKTADGRLIISYDPHTEVIVSGSGLTDDQIMAAAVSLQPVDPSVAPTVTDCSLLTICG